jgi:hypothetical protein
MKWPFMDAKVNRVSDVTTSFALLTTVKQTACCTGALDAKPAISHWLALTSRRSQLIAHQCLATAIRHHTF